jgi:hypothetical protein
MKVGVSNPTPTSRGFFEWRFGCPIQPKILGLRELVPSPNKPPYFGLSKLFCLIPRVWNSSRSFELWVRQGLNSNSKYFKFQGVQICVWFRGRWEEENGSKILKCQGNYISKLWSFSNNTLSCSKSVCVCVCVCEYQSWSSMVLTMNILAWSWYWGLKKFHTSLVFVLGPS